MKCKETNKTCYENVAEAMRTFRSGKNQINPDTYVCKYCGFVHRTSKSKNKKTYKKRNK